MFLRRSLVAALVLYCTSLLPACAAFGDGYTWTRSNRPELPVVWLATGQDAIRTRCEHRTGWITHGCAIYYPDHCEIVAERSEQETPAWIAMHERRHCSGEDHK